MKVTKLAITVYGEIFRIIYDDMLKVIQNKTERHQLHTEVNESFTIDDYLTLIALENEVNEKISN